MYVEEHLVTVTTDGAGAGTSYTPVVTGRVLGVQYIPNGTTPYAGTADVTITLETSTRAVLTLTNLAAAGMFYPKAAVVTPANVAITGNEEPVPVVRERVSIAIAQGGATTTGVFRVLIG